MKNYRETPNALNIDVRVLKKEDEDKDQDQQTRLKPNAYSYTEQ